MKELDTFRGWVAQVRTCPPQLSKKGNIIAPATNYVCNRLTVKIEIGDGVDDRFRVDSIWIEDADAVLPPEMWITPRQWLTWPIKEADHG